MSDPLLRADQSSRPDPLDPSTYILPPEVNRRHALSPSWYRHKTEAYNVEAKFDYKLSENWTSITQANYSRVNRHGGYADFFDIQPNGEIGYADLYQSRGEVFSTWSAQSYIAGKFATGALNHDLFAGIGYKQFSDESPYWDFVESDGTINVSDISVGNILNPIQPPHWNFGAEQAIDFKSKIQESSMFASDLITLNGKFQVLLGGRYIWYKARNLSADALPQDKNIFVPTGAFLYRPVKSIMTYLSYSRGFEKGDYAPFSANNANQPTDAISSTQYELGLKMDVNKRFNLGLALFDIMRDASYLNTANDFVSDGKFHHRGVELNATAGIFRTLTLLGNIAYLNTELKDVTDLATLGKRTEGAPKWKGTLGARYAFTTILPGLSVDCNLNYVGERPVDAQNSGFIPSYTLLDAGVSYNTKIGKTSTSFRLHGRNLTDKYYYAGVYYSGGLEVGRTREIFVTAQFRL
ncbi:MAG: TonB-dependent receptor [Sphingobacterium sp.]